MNKIAERFFEMSVGVFTQADVVVAVQGSNFSRHGLIKRAMANGEILNIRRGLYCLTAKYQKKPVSFYGLAQRIYGPSYISLESALSYQGWIPEAVHACTCVSYHTTRQFETPLGIFHYKPVPQHNFYLGVDRYADKNRNVFFMAKPAKALADYIYLHHLNWATIDEAATSLRIDREEMTKVGSEELSLLVKNYRNSRVKRFLTAWLEAL